MLRFLINLLIVFTLLFFAPLTLASENSFISIVNPIRGRDFWDIKGQTPVTVVKGEVDILKQFNLSATWLIRFDILDDQEIINILNTPTFEKGIFLEITPSLTKPAGVNYHSSENWHSAGSAFLSGYEVGERGKLIDTAFEKFKSVFGYYPTSVGAWWIDSYSLEYMQKKYGINASLIVSDQYSTDNYQIWGQYFSTPYYPSKKNALHPAQNKDDKLPIVLMQWAPRDPVNAYGNGVFESTFSVQANDYTTYHILDINYFSSLIDIYTKQPLNKFAHLVVGLENSYSWQKYSGEYQRQIKVLVDKKEAGQLQIISMKDFASWYEKAFPNISPEQIIFASDPLKTDKKVVWFMNPYYRVGWFFNQDGSVFRDIRQYVKGEEELCYLRACSEVNFATFATRVLDDVTFGHKWVIDQGKISNLQVTKQGEKYVISYINEASLKRRLEFLHRDIGLDDKVFSIDQAILNATTQNIKSEKSNKNYNDSFQWSLRSVSFKIIKFILFLLFICLIPGAVLTRKISNEKIAIPLKIFLSTVVGLVALSAIFYIASELKFKILILIYILIFIIWFFRLKLLRFKFSYPSFRNPLNNLAVAIILAGTIFQSLPVFKSGLTFSYGLGFWGPNTHDGTWHVALINQLVKAVPPENPIFAGSLLKNYHFFYDLLIASTNFLTGIPVMDLLFRFYPILLSLLLGIGTYHLVVKLFGRVVTIFSLYLTFFAGSFGWIVEYISQKHLGGESAFWANQSISFNLNPPFAVSLVIIIAFLHILINLPKIKNWQIKFVAILLAGMLIGFKAYGAVLILATLLIVGLVKFIQSKEASYLLVFSGSSLIAAILFLSNFQTSAPLVIFAPFWFIHSMIDSPDRVGWSRLSLMRMAGLSSGNWFKFLSAEVISLFLFIIGNLGTRVFALFSLLKIKTILRQTEYLFLFIFSTLSLLIPILFIQAGNPWNTIQFIYYFLYISALVGGITFAAMVVKIKKIFALTPILFFAIITPINSWATANGYLSATPHALISKNEVEALQFLNSQPDGIVLTYPYDSKLKRNLKEPWPLLAYDSTAYVSAMSRKISFIEDEIQNQILLTDYKKRIVAAKDFYNAPNVSFLRDNKIKYVYLPKIFNVSLDSDKLKIKLIYENDEALIYQVIDI